MLHFVLGIQADVTADDYRPNRESLSNSEIRATGILCGGAVSNIAREAIASRERIAQSEQRVKELEGENAELKKRSIDSENESLKLTGDIGGWKQRAETLERERDEWRNKYFEMEGSSVSVRRTVS